MNRIYIIIFSVIWFSCGQKKELSTTETQPELAETLIYELMPPTDFINKYKQAVGAVLVDLRTREELEEGIIEGAIHIDFKDKMFKSNLESLDKDVPYFIYCTRGGRSGKAAAIMKELKFKKVYGMEGGYTAWTFRGLKKL